MFFYFLNLVRWQVRALCSGYNRCRTSTPGGVVHGFAAYAQQRALRAPWASPRHPQSGRLLGRDYVRWQDFPWLKDVVRAKQPRRLPVVLTRQEVRVVLNQLSGTPRLMAVLLYGAGLRLLECAQLRVKDVDFSAGQMIVRDGKGEKDRGVGLMDEWPTYGLRVYPGELEVNPQ